MAKHKGTPWKTEWRNCRVCSKYGYLNWVIFFQTSTSTPKLMTSFQTIITKTPDSTLNFRKRGVQYALVLSLVLHIGAALVIIIASGFSTGVKNTNFIIVQDFSLTPSISAPAKSTSAPPAPHPAMTSTARTAAQKADNRGQEPTSEQPPNPSGSSENTGGMVSAPLGFGDSHGYFSGQAAGRKLRGDIRGYYLEMVKKINLEWWDKASFLKEPLRHDSVFELLVQRDGTIVSIRILQGTGSSDSDRLLTETIRKASPLPPLPSTYEPDLFKTSLRIKAPPLEQPIIQTTSAIHN